MTSWIKKVSLLVAALALFACSNGNGGGTAALVDGSGKHPSGWLEQHWTQLGSLARKDPAAAAAAAAASGLHCLQCHGSDLLGGISKVSCFADQAPSGQACHAGVLGHPADWGRAIRHGQGGAMAPAGLSSGLAYCGRCHGSDFKGAGNAASCFSCHTKAPHPNRPWIGGNLSHGSTVPTNAAACFPCHEGARNFGAVIVSPALAASPPAPTPDCFNQTLCHGGSVRPPHQPVSAAYLQASQHGSDAAGLSASPSNLTSCRACHAGATGRFNQPSHNMASGCETCHAPFTAHPTPWLPGRAGTATQFPTPSNPNATSHATVLAANLGSDCALCHGALLDGVGGNGAPSCMSNSAQFGVSCHLSSPSANPTGCSSCHAFNLQHQPATGAHGTHLRLAGVNCESCHSGGGADPVTRIGAARHAQGFAQLSTAVFGAKTGGMRYDAGSKTCSNVRCHGGKTTPAWTASLDTADCLLCHQSGSALQTPQYNSFYSGLFPENGTQVHLHDRHLATANPLAPSRKIACADCHAVTDATHFGGLGTPSFETSPGSTVKFQGQQGSQGIYLLNATTGAATCSNVACHPLAARFPFPANNNDWGK